MIEFVRKLIKNGRGSYYLNIPKEVVDHFGFRERQKLTVEQQGDKVVIKDWKK